MNLTNAIMDLVLMGLLLLALWFGMRLNKNLKALRAGQEGFARAVQELDQAAIRAHNSLRELRGNADESQDLLHGRILAARDLMQKLDAQVARAERSAHAIDSGLATMANLQSRAEQTAKRLEAAPRPELARPELARPEPVRPEPVRPGSARVEPVRPQPRLEEDADYNPAWAAPKAPIVARGAEARSPESKRDPFERDIIRFNSAHVKSDEPRRSLLPDVVEEDEAEMMDKVQMSELVVANLNEMIRSFSLPTRQVLSVEDDLFGGGEPSAPDRPARNR